MGDYVENYMDDENSRPEMDSEWQNKHITRDEYETAEIIQSKCEILLNFYLDHPPL